MSEGEITDKQLETVAEMLLQERQVEHFKHFIARSDVPPEEIAQAPFVTRKTHHILYAKDVVKLLLEAWKGARK